MFQVTKSGCASCLGGMVGEDCLKPSKEKNEDFEEDFELVFKAA